MNSSPVIALTFHNVHFASQRQAVVCMVSVTFRVCSLPDSLASSPHQLLIYKDFLLPSVDLVSSLVNGLMFYCWLKHTLSPTSMARRFCATLNPMNCGSYCDERGVYAGHSGFINYYLYCGRAARWCGRRPLEYLSTFSNNHKILIRSAITRECNDLLIKIPPNEISRPAFLSAL